MMTLTAADGHKFQVFEAGNVNAPRGLIMGQEIFGVNQHIRETAENLARFGYRVLVPALFDRAAPDITLGYTPQDVQEGIRLRAEITPAQTLLDLEATAASFGEARPVGMVGYCWGGSLAWVMATQTTRLKAASCWYGAQIIQTKDATPHCPVQMHFGAEDHSIPAADVAAIQAAQPQAEIYVYAGAQHGFGCASRPSYSAPDHELALLRTLTFFAEHLR